MCTLGFIGSGATAVTLVPALATRAAHVTMLQRSPTYIVSLPAVVRVSRRLRRALPAGLAHGAVKWKNVLLSSAFYKAAGAALVDDGGGRGPHPSPRRDPSERDREPRPAPGARPRGDAARDRRRADVTGWRA